MSWLRIGGTDGLSKLPSLTPSAQTDSIKPLAVVLGRGDSDSGTSPVLTYQPYGTGKVVVLTDGTRKFPTAASEKTEQTPIVDIDALNAEHSGGLDAYTKRAINIALSVLSQCEPDLKMHIEKARTMGYNQVEIDEAAQIAIDTGAPSIEMFYKKFMNSEL